MDFRIDPDFEKHLRPLTPAEYERLAAKIEYEGCAEGALVVAQIGDDRILVDGHNTFKICREKKLKLCTPRIISLPSREAALEWIEHAQQARRNATPEEMQIARQKRIERVVTARAKGKSLRMIGDEEGVSQTQIARDLETATVTGVTVDPECKVTGKDGKKRPAHNHESAFCDRCKRVGPKRGCSDCAALKSSTTTKSNGKLSKRPKPGSVKFDFREADKHFGDVVRWPDEIARAYEGEKESSEYKAVMELLDPLGEIRKAWHRRLTKVKEKP